MQTYFLANWKENGSLILVQQMCAALNALSLPKKHQVILFPPAVYLSAAATLAVPNILLGAQNLSAYAEGAYTGEISGAMLVEVGAHFVLVGHSERRQFFGDANNVVAAKFSQAVLSGLCPVLCVGETLLDYEAGQTEVVITEQLTAVFAACPAPLPNFIIAYEPVWAIGTGKSAQPEQAQTMHALIRRCLSQYVGSACAEQTPILYGGSVKADNAAQFLAMPDIQGVLVGGASLVPEEFCRLVQSIPNMRHPTA